MEDKELSLSEKIIRKYPHINYVREMILVTDVKEFIKRLKDEIEKSDVSRYIEVFEIIDRLAGKELVE